MVRIQSFSLYHDDVLMRLLVCYPPHGLGPAGARAVISFFEDDEETNKV